MGVSGLHNRLLTWSGSQNGNESQRGKFKEPELPEGQTQVRLTVYKIPYLGIHLCCVAQSLMLPCE